MRLVSTRIEQYAFCERCTKRRKTCISSYYYKEESSLTSGWIMIFRVCRACLMKYSQLTKYYDGAEVEAVGKEGVIYTPGKRREMSFESTDQAPD